MWKAGKTMQQNEGSKIGKMNTNGTITQQDGQNHTQNSKK